jgi:hypothetical protein
VKGEDMSIRKRTLIRGCAVALFALTMMAIVGCSGGPGTLKGRLIYQDDPARSTGGDSVWVYVKGQEEVGATVLVKPDNTWVYQPKPGKVHNIWSPTGQLPPLKTKEGESAPIIMVGAQTADHKTRLLEVYYSEQKGIPLELEYVPLPAADDTKERKTIDQVDDVGGISP